MLSRIVRLKPGKEKSLKRRHPWIFSGAIEQLPADCQPGELLPVHASDGAFLALAYFQPGNSLSGRVLSFEDRAGCKTPHPRKIDDFGGRCQSRQAGSCRSDETIPERVGEEERRQWAPKGRFCEGGEFCNRLDSPVVELFREKIIAALKRREPFLSSSTTGYRLINAEGDELPGLIVDRYADLLVIQITTAGIDRLKIVIVDLLADLFRPKAIYEKSHGPAREQEGLKDAEGFLYGEADEEVEILENDLKFIVSFRESQKTGFFLDQREMRKLVRQMAHQKTVLNGFAYTGGFSIAALAGGAKSVDSVEISRRAEPILERNLAINGLVDQRHRFFREDMFDFLAGSTLDYDLIILDPPAFAKKRSDVDIACRGYKQLMLEVMRKAKPGALLLFSSCSYFVDEGLFQTVAFQAALEAKRSVTLLSRHRQGFDHPISLFHPEGEYLKSLILHIS